MSEPLRIPQALLVLGTRTVVPVTIDEIGPPLWPWRMRLDPPLRIRAGENLVLVIAVGDVPIGPGSTSS